MEVQTSGKSIDSVLERVLCMNILSSDYFKELYRLKTYHDVVDEIYNQVDHVEPWMTGNCRGPSTAFCLLYKFFTMKLTVKQMQGLLNHEDSPYIRAVGFLYLRYVGEPRSLWSWFEEYVTDGEEFSPGSNGKMTTIGVFVRDLLLDQYYFDTLFPRIPVPIMRQLTGNLERLKLSTRSAGVTGTSNRHSLDDTARRPPSVKAALSVSFGQRAPHRSSTRDSSPVRRSATREQRTADDRIGSERTRERVDRETGLGFTSHKEKTRERIDKETGLGFNSHKDTGSARQKGGDSSRIEERNGESVRLSATDGQFTTSGFHRDSDNEASMPSNSSDGIRSNRMKVDEVRRKRERGHREDEEQYKSRSSEKRKERNKRGRERSRSYSPQKDRDEEDIRLMRTHRGLGNQGNNLGKLRDVYGDRSSRGSPATCNTGSSKGSAEDVIRLGDGRWT